MDLLTCFYASISFYNNVFCVLAYSELPAFLVNNGGLNSGFMIAQCTAAALGTCDNRRLTSILVLTGFYRIATHFRCKGHG